MYFFKDRLKNTQNICDTIGLDIGSSAIKWVSLGSHCELKRYAIEAIPIPVGTTQIKVATYVAAILKRTLLKQDDIKNCVLNIPDPLVCSKWAQIDYGYKNIEEIIKTLVEKLIPYPLDKLYFDYQIFDPPSECPEKFKVLIVACRKEHLDFRLDIIHQANLVPVAVEASSHALERANDFFYPESIHVNRILLDVGLSQLTLLFFNQHPTIVYSEILFNTLEQEFILSGVSR